MIWFNMEAIQKSDIKSDIYKFDSKPENQNLN